MVDAASEAEAGVLGDAAREALPDVVPHTVELPTRDGDTLPLGDALGRGDRDGSADCVGSRAVALCCGVKEAGCTVGVPLSQAWELPDAVCVGVLLCDTEAEEDKDARDTDGALLELCRGEAEADGLEVGERVALALRLVAAEREGVAPPEAEPMEEAVPTPLGDSAALAEGVLLAAPEPDTGGDCEADPVGGALAVPFTKLEGVAAAEAPGEDDASGEADGGRDAAAEAVDEASAEGDGAALGVPRAGVLLAGPLREGAPVTLIVAEAVELVEAVAETEASETVGSPLAVGAIVKVSVG